MLATVLLSVARAAPGDAVEPTLVADFAPGEVLLADSSDVMMGPLLGDQRWLLLDDGVHGSEPWLSDGSPAGTRLADDLVVGAAGSEVIWLANVGGSTCFFAETGPQASDLWCSDGSQGGSRVVARLAPGGSPAYLLTWTKASDGRVVYFSAADGDSGQSRLWRTDATVAGTRPLFSLQDNDVPVGLFEVGGRILVTRHEPGTGIEWWSYDPTTKAHAILADLAPGEADGAMTTNSESMGAAQWAGVVVGDAFYFKGFDGRTHGLWISDGTAAGTHRLATFAGPLAGAPSPFAVLGDVVVFVGADAEFGAELWVSDGSVAGTRPLRDVRVGPETSLPILDDGYMDILPGFARVGDRLLFLADDGVHGFEPWVTDGTPGGTGLVRDVRPGPAGCVDAEPGYGVPSIAPTPIGGRVLLSMDDGVGGVRAWVSDGTSEGTFPLIDADRIATLGAETLQVRDDFRLVTERDGTGARFLWSTDGTPDGTIPILATEDFGVTSGYPYPSSRVGRGRIFFLGDEVWGTDGTAVGTAVLWRRGTVPIDGSPRQLMSLGAHLLVRARTYSSANWERLEWMTVDSAGVRSLRKDVPLQVGPFDLGGAVLGDVAVLAEQFSYREIALVASDGTEAGTLRLSPAVAPTTVLPEEFFVSGEQVYVRARRLAGDGSIVSSVLVSDGSDAGTREVWHTDAWIEGLAAHQGRIYFWRDGELWRVDEAASTAEVIFKPQPGEYRAAPRGPFVGVQDRLFFVAPHDPTGFVAWATDGSPGGTRPLVDASFCEAPDDASAFANVRGATYFGATDGTGEVLWRSNGTAAGTHAVATIRQGGTPSAACAIGWLTEFADRLYFVADDGVHGPELWVSDGTAAGTRLYNDLWPGAPGARPMQLAVAAGWLWFSAATPLHGREAWRTDGRSPCAVIETEVDPGAGSSSPADFTAVGDVVYFSARRADIGRELWSVTVTSTPADAGGGNSGCTLRGAGPDRDAVWLLSIPAFILLWRKAGAAGANVRRWPRAAGRPRRPVSRRSRPS